MSLFSRWLIYLICAGATFAIGRYLFPASQGLFGSKPGETEHSQQQFWEARVAECQSAATPAERLQKSHFLLDRLRAGDFPKMFAAAKSDPLLHPIVAAQWAQTAPNSLFTHLASNGVKTPEEQRLAAIFLYEWARQDEGSATAAASRLRLPDSAFDSRKPVALALLRMDVHRGVTFLQQNSVGLTNEEIQRELRATDLTAQNWPEKNLADRASWLQDLPQTAWRDGALESVYGEWVAQNPQAVLEAAQQKGASSRHIGPAVATWIKRSYAEAANFYKDGARDEVRAALGIALAQHSAAEAPQQAWDFARWGLSGATRCEALLKVVSTAAAKDPTVPAAWLSDCAPGSWLPAALREVHRVWKERDAIAADAWAAALDPAKQAALSPQVPSE